MFCFDDSNMFEHLRLGVPEPNACAIEYERTYLNSIDKSERISNNVPWPGSKA